MDFKWLIFAKPAFERLRQLTTQIVLAFIAGSTWTLAIIELSDWRPFQTNISRLEVLLLWSVLAALAFGLILFIQRALAVVKKSELILYGGISLVMGAILATFSPHPSGQLMFVPQNLRIETSQADSARCIGLKLNGFETDGDYVSYNSMLLQGWKRVQKSLALTDAENLLTWQGYARYTTLIMQGGTASCHFQVTWNNIQSRYIINPGSTVTISDAHPQPWYVGLVGFWSLGLSAASLLYVLIAGFAWLWKVFPLKADLPGVYSGVALQRRDWFLIILSGLAAAGVFLLATSRFGVYLGSDSTSYISAGRSLAAGKGYIMMDGDTYTWWPPLYPLMISIGYFLHGFNPLVYMRLLNSACFAITVAGWGWLNIRLMPHGGRFWYILLTLLLVLSPAMLTTHTFILSEPSFFVVETGFFVFLDRYFRNHQYSDAVLFSFCTGLAVLSRYIGVVVVLAGAVVVLVHCRGSLKARLTRAMLPVGLGSLPIIMWMLHNRIMTGELTGRRTPSFTPLSTNLQDFAEAVSGWFSPNLPSIVMPMLAVVLVLIIFIVMRKIPAGAIGPDEMTIISLILFVLCYTAWLVISLSILENAPIGNRLMSPIYIPLLLIFTYGLDKLPVRGLARQASWAVLALLVAIPAVNCLQSTLKSEIISEADKLSIYSLNGDRILDYIQTNSLPADGIPYSNCPRCLTIFSNIYNVQILNEVPSNRPYLPGPGQTINLIWFNRINIPPPSKPEGSYIAKLPDLHRLLGMDISLEAIVENEDGGIYRIELPR